MTLIGQTQDDVDRLAGVEVEVAVHRQCAVAFAEVERPGAGGPPGWHSWTGTL